jgi:hypothetical protein
MYAGPFDAIKKIYSAHGIAGIYKGQAVTLLREATGYGVYFLSYEKLIQWEMHKKGIRRDQINPMNTVLYGAAAGYAVSLISEIIVLFLTKYPALGSYIPHRYDQVKDANRWLHTFNWSKIYLYTKLRSNNMADRRP